MNNIHEFGYSLEYPSYESAKAFPNISGFPVSDILIGMTYPFPNYRLIRKSKNKYYLIECILEGKGKVKYQDEYITVQKGDVVFFDKSSDQHFSSVKSDPMKKIWITFSSTYIDKMVDAYGISTGVYSVDTIEIFEKLFDLSRLDTSNYNELILLIAENIHSIILTLASLKFKPDMSEEAKLKNALSKAIYSKNSLDDISHETGISKVTLIRNFKKMTGITPYQYILSEKMRVAKSYLKTTNMSVKEIAYLLCFTSEHYFSYYFTKYCKMTPTEYRRKDGK